MIRDAYALAAVILLAGAICGCICGTLSDRGRQ